MACSMDICASNLKQSMSESGSSISPLSKSGRDNSDSEIGSKVSQKNGTPHFERQTE